jgi:bifunctional non-homologous end joining protein LigD
MVEVEGRQLRLSNLNKVLYPAVGFTKGDVIDYYVRIAPALLPHLAGRALTLKRFPEGVQGFHFYEKNCPPHRPDWMKTARVWSKGNRRFMHYCLVEDLPTLVWLANLADLELHTSLSRAPENDQPTMMVFDLDPGAPANIVACCQVAVWVRELLDELGLQSFAKTSGSKGLQVCVPLNAPVTPVTYDQTKSFAHALARLLENRHPEQVVSEMKKVLRPNKVFVDWSQNDSYKTTICVYSLRGKDRPTVSTPVTWKEVEECLKKNDPELLVFTSADVLQRVQKLGDLFEPVLTVRQQMPKLEENLKAESRPKPEAIQPRAETPTSARKKSVARRRKPASREKTRIA